MWLHPILKTFAYTGIRRGELLKLKWCDVDLKKRKLYIRSKKQSQKQAETIRSIPISKQLLEALQKQKKNSGNRIWVFLGRSGSGQLNKYTLGDAITRLVKDTEFAGIGTHIFRHSLASNLAIRGEDQRRIDNILGHQTEAMRQRYQHLFPEELKTSLDELDM